MVQWSDLGAGLRVAFGVAWSGSAWLGFLRRWLFSPVGLLCWAALAATFAVGAFVFGGLGLTDDFSPKGLFLLLVLGGPLALVALAAIDLPHLLWAAHPSATLALRKRLRLAPPQVTRAPSFRRYITWSGPLVMTLLATAVVYQRPAVRDGNFEVLFLMGAAFVAAACAGELFVRSALGSHFAPEQVEDFADATRMDRILLWVPGLLAAGLAVHFALDAVLPDTPLLGAVLELLIGLELLRIAALAGSAALLLACSRGLQGPEEPIASQTMMMPQRPRVGARYPAPTLSPAKVIAALALFGTVLAAGGFAMRMELTDVYFLRDPVYRNASASLHGRFAGGTPRQAADGDERLHAGLVAFACGGDLRRARWLSNIGVASEDDHQRILACAVCDRRANVLEWITGVQPGLGTGIVALAAEGPPGSRSLPVGCALAQDDVPLAQQLLKAGSDAGAFDDPRSPVQLAIAQQRWDVVRLLLRERPKQARKVLFTALQQAHARDPKLPALVAARLVEAGVPLHTRDASDRSVLHWAAYRHDLALARFVLQQSPPPGFGPDHADEQGALPWMHVLRRAELDGRPMNEAAVELLRLLLPPEGTLDTAIPAMDPTRGALFPAGWTAARVALNQPAVHALLGERIDYGQLSGDAESWWKFASLQHAEEFVRSATPAQLARAENPQATGDLPPKKLSTALAEAGWTALAAEVERTQRPGRAATR